MVKRSLLVLSFFVIMVAAVGPAAGQNPFTGKKEPPDRTPALSAHLPFLSKLTLWQHQLRETMAGLVARAKRDQSLRPLAMLILLSFAYGMLHAAGPGHGKGIAMSYSLTGKPSYKRGLLFGTSVALVHGLTGIIFVLIVGAVLKAGISGPLEQVTRATQVVSYALIILIGLAILIRAIRDRRTGHGVGRHGDHPKPPGHQWPAALAIGMVPCPGVVMVALFSVSMGLLGLGVILGLAISLGMALTISMVILAVTAGKKVAFYPLTGHGRWLSGLETALEIGGGVLVSALGTLLLLAAI